MNEEDIRGKLLLPYLTSLGFNLSEISLEYSFKIRLGKNQRALGRSDILCKRNNKNLFVIELKRDSVEITTDDVEQGISYARALLDNIAPFVILTNGKSTQIFDTITKAKISGTNISGQSQYLKNDYTLSSEEDLRLRYEALKSFISFSESNLKIFCDNQVKDRMGTAYGAASDPAAKFISNLYTERPNVQSTFNEFANSDCSFLDSLERLVLAKQTLYVILLFGI